MTTYREAVQGTLSFGDLCAADFLFDVRACSASVSVVSWPAPEGVDLAGLQVSIHRGRERAGLVLAAGGPVKNAAVVSDDCEIDTVLGLRRTPPKAKGNIWFAPVLDVESESLRKQFEHSDSYARLPLPADELVAVDRLVDLRFAFPVEGAAVLAALRRGMGDGDSEEGDPAPFARHSLADDLADELAVHWAAFAARRGPLVARDNAGKLAQLLTAVGLPEADAEAAMASCVPVVETAWRFEGRGLDGAGAAFDADNTADPRPFLDAILDDLGDLRERVNSAIAIIGAVRTRL